MMKLFAILLSSLAITAHGADVVLGMPADLTWTGAGTTQVASFGAADVLDGLIARWSFETGSGTQAIDSISGYTAYFRGNPVWTNGVSGGGIFFNATDAYLTAGDVCDIGTGSFTYAFWFKTTNTAGAAGQGVIGKIGVVSNGAWATYRTQNATAFANILDPFAIINATTTNQTSGTWHQFACTMDRSANRIVYYDGLAKASNAISSHAGANWNTAFHLIFGAYQSSNGQTPIAGTYFGGALDEIRVYNRALSSNEVFTIWNKYKP